VLVDGFRRFGTGIFIRFDDDGGNDFFSLGAGSLGGGFDDGTTLRFFFTTSTILRIQCIIFCLIAGFGLFELAQCIFAFVILRGFHLIAFDIGAFLTDFNRNGGFRLAGAYRQFFDLAALERDLFGCFAFGSLFIFAMGAAQETQQLHLLGTTDHLIWPTECHARTCQLL